MTLKQNYGVQAIASVVLLLTFVFSFNVAHAQSTPAALSTSFENGALTVQGSSFASSARVNVQTTLAGNVRNFSAGTGPQGDFVLHTSMPLVANAPLFIEVSDDRGTVTTASLVIPATIAPFLAIGQLPGAAAFPRTSEVTQLGALLMGLVLVVLGVIAVTRRNESWSYSEMRAQIRK